MYPMDGTIETLKASNARLRSDKARLLSACQEALITVTERCRIERINPDASPTVLCLRKAINES
ncbi:hypothetical protein LCGC14_2792090 [marine sediment metagenome]|uniref:Uncharacterized protein n=1 Tax=marine sediment metagenome TaxID=412755 RepID=A0A0F8ZCA7_9ZZZZ